MKYNLFGTKTGLYSSEFILGTANFGTRSGYGADPVQAKEILTAYADAGGNFIDTSDAYQLGQSEEILGEFLEGQRSNFIISTKYTRSNTANPAISNFGNHRKAMRQSVESSLKRLKTDYIDIYMPHYDDGITPIDEISRGLEDLINSGKILYTGLSNFPVWKASAIASSIKLSAIQIEYNLLQRTADREFIKMSEYYGLGTMMYSPLSGGQLTGKYRRGEKGRINRNSEEYREDDIAEKIINELFAIAEEFEATPGQVALAWVLAKGGFPLVGARKIEHFNDALKSTTIVLSENQIQKLDELSSISLGYPHELLKNVRGF
jgi:aryl-alcohol dehydrogenase-like predicted oxidoreductase